MLCKYTDVDFLKSPVYRPFLNGKYEVVPGLRKFGADLGNPDFDNKVFQISRNFDRYIESKKSSRSESLEKYYVRSKSSEAILRHVGEWIANRLCVEYPQYFSFNDDHIFKSELSGELIDLKSPGPYVDPFDAVVMQVPEDVAIWKLDFENKAEYLHTVHLSSPNFWDPREKVGRSFTEVHLPVAGIERVSRFAWGLLESVFNKGPFVRFAWGVGSDHRLNHHPEPPKGISLEEWQGRSFNRESPELFVRVERQVLWPLPEVSSILFTIKTYFIDGKEIKTDPLVRQSLVQAINSMTPESLKYKGLTETRTSVVDWLNS